MSVHRNFGIYTRDSSLTHSISAILPSPKEYSYTVQNFQSIEAARDYLLYDLPDFFIIDLSSESQELEQMRRIMQEDPWLGGVGVVGLQGSVDKKDFLQLSADWNILALVQRDDMEGLQKVLHSIVKTPALILDYQKTSPFHQSSSGILEIPNDLREAEKLAGIIASYLLRSGRIDKKKFYNLSMSLSELLINAIEHGNCEISFTDKTRLLEQGVNLADYIDELNQNDGKIGSRKVTLEYSIEEDSSSWKVRDMGKGFKFKKYLNPENQDVMLPHGRGILMAVYSSDSLTYNDIGNEVTLVCNHQKEDDCRIPKGLLSEEIVLFDPGEVIFSENEDSTYLYYILNGEFEVAVGGVTVGHLVPADVFLGEMSFLLNRRRTAKVTATKKSRLLKISHRSFIRIVKAHPNYMLVLARILAQRLERSNLCAG